MRNVEKYVIIHKENLTVITMWSTKNVSFAINEPFSDLYLQESSTKGDNLMPNLYPFTLVCLILRNMTFLCV